jgi:hypothetical protein
MKDFRLKLVALAGNLIVFRDRLRARGLTDAQIRATVRADVPDPAVHELLEIVLSGSLDGVDITQLDNLYDYIVGARKLAE